MTEKVVAYLDETGALFVLEGTDVRALFDEMPKPPFGRKLLPLTVAAPSQASIAPPQGARVVTDWSPPTPNPNRIVDLKRRIESAHGSIKPKDDWIA
jgi:hypothetical protein